MPIRRRIEIDDQLWHGLRHLSLETGRSMNEIADKAFRNYLRSLHRPVTLREGLVKSLRMIPANEQPKASVHRLRRRG